MSAAVPSPRVVALRAGADLAGFRAAVRRLVHEDVSPQAVAWSGAETPDLFGGAEPGMAAGDVGHEAPPVALPRAAADLIEAVVCHRDAERYALLYELVWRLKHGEPGLLEAHADPLVHRLGLMQKTVRRELHKMHAFLRFRRTAGPDGSERFVAWFEPEHFILEATAQFFVDRFRSLHWTILTPIGSLVWDRESLHVGPPAERGHAPDEDTFEAGWADYYASTFNPARLNPGLMQAHMPKRYWRNMPEARVIPRLVENAGRRVTGMIEREASMPRKKDPERAVAAMTAQQPQSLDELNRIIAQSEPLVPGATQAVLGEGPVGAEIAFVGEQPGDQEDREGRPFVGPAGQVLTRAMQDAGIARARAYVTNAVKHFKYEQRGKRRIHQKPTTGEVKHYRWWLIKELELVRPRVVVALGATAALALTGKPTPILRARGPAVLDRWPGFITVHPSYLLRLPDEDEKARAYGAFVDDLKRAKLRAESGAVVHAGNAA